MPQPRNVFMFSGQGSQYFHMGSALYDRPGTFREWMDRLDAILLRQVGCSVVRTLYEPGRASGEVFDRTLLTHPAIFMVEYALAMELIELGVQPHLTLGVSLGTFAAAAVAGCLDVESALLAVAEQARILEAHCSPGSMTAVLGDPRLYEQPPLRGNCDLAASNFPNHFVVSAPPQSMTQIEGFLGSARITYQRLPVSFAFHSRWIEPAAAPSREHFGRLATRRARIPLACCATETILHSLPMDYFWSVARSPIRFQQTLAALELQGPFRYIDAGPAGTLATFLKYLLPPGGRSSVHPTLTPFGRDRQNLAALTAVH
jgi:acyl transferase domain-containing protein